MYIMYQKDVANYGGVPPLFANFLSQSGRFT
jgi:hypothetical protein